MDVVEVMTSINRATNTTEITTTTGMMATMITVDTLAITIIVVQHTMPMNPAIVACHPNG
ncbi:hypothetical protein D4L85_08185 [Chryseolinea soli]|uniref:Uncharacterized protein n=1 Tax=Chryseolinea soli TaxID=2321403 RepID=A0A385SJB4_9BACT|nr:hypothetical protein D4L85_08185 [Chryseolinea soli]